MNAWTLEYEEADSPEHMCGPYCRTGLHATLAESTPTADLADARAALMGEVIELAGVGDCRVEQVCPALEAPVDDPDYPNVWLVLLRPLAGVV